MSDTIIEHDGLKIVDNDEDAAFGSRRAGTYEQEIIDFFKTHPGDYFMDVGSRHGWHGLHASLVGYTPLFFEPSRSHWRTIQSLELNDIVGSVYPISLSDQDGVLRMRDTRDEFYEIDQGGDLTIPCRRADSLFSVEDFKDKTVGVKVDVEGHEESVISGFEGILEEIDYLAVEHHPSIVDVEPAMKLVESFGFIEEEKIMRNQILCLYKKDGN